MDLPDFNTNALESLTKKIQDNLKKPATNGARDLSNGKGRDQEYDKGDKKARVAQKAVVGEKHIQKTTVGAGHGTNGIDKPLKGKKRLRNGQVKESGNEAAKISRAVEEAFDRHKNKGTGIPKEKSTHRPGKSSRNKVSEKAFDHQISRSNGIKAAIPRSAKVPANYQSAKEQILELGGTEEDLSLWNDIPSESEVEGSASKTSNGRLMSDLHRTLKDLGIDGLGAQDASSESEHDEDEDEDEGPEAPGEDSNPNGIALKPRLSRTQMVKDVNGKGFHTRLVHF